MPAGLANWRIGWGRFFEGRLLGQSALHHKPPEVLKSKVFCFWSAGGSLTVNATLTQ